MKCPFCGEDYDKVLDTRKSQDGYSVRRRRECIKCLKRFTTHETVELSTIIIIKKSGSKEPYEKSKIMAGLLKACEKRPVEIRTIEQVTEKIDRRIRSLGKSEILSQQIGEFITEMLKEVDIIAYIRFISVYKKFDSLQSFIDELNSAIKNH